MTPRSKGLLGLIEQQRNNARKLKKGFFPSLAAYCAKFGFTCFRSYDQAEGASFLLAGLTVDCTTEPCQFDPMCNLYSMTSSQAAITYLVKLWRDDTGNLPAMWHLPDYPAPVITQEPQGRAMRMMRWGMPPPEFVLKGKKTDKGVTNVRNTASPHWRRWLGPAHRCTALHQLFGISNCEGRAAQACWFAPTGPQRTTVLCGYLDRMDIGAQTEGG